MYNIQCTVNLVCKLHAMHKALYNIKGIFRHFLHFVFLLKVITFFGVFKLRILSRGLVGIQEYYKQNALIDEQATKKAMTKFLLAILPFLAFLIIFLT